MSYDGVKSRTFTLWLHPSWPRLLAYAVPGCILLFVALVPAGHLHWFYHWTLWQNPALGRKFDVSGVMLWLAAANLTSLAAVLMLWWAPMRLQRKVAGLELKLDTALAEVRCGLKKTAEAEARPVAWATGPLAGMHALSVVILIATLFCIVLIWPSGFTVGHERLFWIAVWTGFGYMFVTAVSDWFACIAYKRVTCLKPGDASTAASTKRRREALDDLIDDLGDYQRIFLYVDVPILISLTLITLHKIVLGPRTYYLGFVAGAVAMHIVLGNIMAVMIAGSRTVSLDDLGMMQAVREKRRAWKWVVSLAMILGTTLYANYVRRHGAVRIGMTKSASAWPAIIGDEEGLFGDLPVEIKPVANVEEAYRNQEIDICLADSLSESIRMIHGKLDLNALSKEAAPFQIRVIATTIADKALLKGKSVAVPDSPVCQAVLDDALREAGILKSDVNIYINDDALGKLQRREVDAAVLSDASPDPSYHVLFESPGVLLGPKSITSDVATRDRLVSGWQKAVEVMRTRPADACEIAKRKLGMDDDSGKTAQQ